MGVELSEEQVARVDEVYETVYDMVARLCGDGAPPNEMVYIGPLTDQILETLEDYGISVRMPTVVTNADGTQYVAESVRG